MGRRRLSTLVLLGAALLAGCSGGGNPAEASNAALAAFAADLQAYGAADLSSVEGDQITPATVQTWATQLDAARESFLVLETEMRAVAFPEEFTTRGQPAQSTIDEYLIATDQYLAINEQAISAIQQCIDTGASAYDCTAQVGTEMMMGVYPQVLQRSQAAALQLQSEISRA